MAHRGGGLLLRLLLPPFVHRLRPPATLNFVRTLKEIRIVEEGDSKRTIVVEGVPIPSDMKARLIDPERIPWSMSTTTTTSPAASTNGSAGGCCAPFEQCHPLCRLPFVNQIKHTDVLILNQFISNDGKVIEREVTGLCKRQHKRVEKLIKMAQKAGLFPGKDFYKADKEKHPWQRLNSYWDEKTIDVQWHENARKKKRSDFEK